MAVSYRSKSTGVNTTTTGNSTDTEPASAASGDVLIAICVFAAGSSTAANAAHPSGWTLLGSVTQGAFKANFAYVIRGGSAPTLTWTTAGASIYREIQIICLTGAASLTLDSQSSSGATGNANHQPDPPATTAVATTSMAVCCGVNWGGPVSTITAPSGYTLRTDGTAPSGFDGQMATKSLSASGSEDPGAFANFSTSASDYWDGFTVTFTDVTATATPFPGMALTLPVLKINLIADQRGGYQMAASTWLFGKDVQFGGPGQFKTYDWPNPRGYPFSLSNRGYEQQALLRFFGNDVFFDGAGKAPTYDWPNPLIKGRSISLLTWAWNYLPYTPLTPFFLTDWPLPLRPLNPVERGFVDASEFWMLKDTFFGGPGQPPSRAPDPNPRGAGRSIDVISWVQDLLQTTLLPSSPFASGDWPNPLGRPFPLSLRTHTGFFYSPVGVPFVPIEWMNPPGKEFGRDRGFVSPLKLNLLGKDTFFFGPGRGPTYDWPNPRGATYPVILRTYSNDRRGYLLPDAVAQLIVRLILYAQQHPGFPLELTQVSPWLLYAEQHKEVQAKVLQYLRLLGFIDEDAT